MPDEVDNNQTEPVAPPPPEPVLENTPPAPPEATVVEQNPPTETQTAQIPVNEPIRSGEVQPSSAESSGEAKPETPPQVEIIPPSPTPAEPTPPTVAVFMNPINKAKEIWGKAMDAIQNRKGKRLNKIMTLFDKSAEITNDQVEKLLHISDATASRYLSQLVKEGKIKQNKKSGRGVTYTKI